jgi:hypothetical protein
MDFPIYPLQREFETQLTDMILPQIFYREIGEFYMLWDPLLKQPERQMHLKKNWTFEQWG